MRWSHSRDPAREARSSARPVGRTLALFATGTSHGADTVDRHNRARHHHGRGREQSLWCACAPPPRHRGAIYTRRPRSLMSLHSRGPDDGSLISSAKTMETGTAAQVVLAFDDNKLASILFGQYGQNLALIERRLGVVAEQRGNHVTVEGSRGACEQARRALEGLYEQLKRGHDLSQGDVEGAI